MDKSVPETPTAVLLHGILGSRKNWGTHLITDFPDSTIYWYFCQKIQYLC